MIPTEGPPVHILLARLAHTLESAKLALVGADYERTLLELDAARGLLEQIQRKAK